MESAVITRHMHRLAGCEGVAAVALVDRGSGLIVHEAGQRPVQPALWEAAVDYWRLHGRISAHFSALGDLGAAVLYHRNATLCVLPCGKATELFVACIAEHRSVDWIRWQRLVRVFGEEFAAR